MNNSDNLRHNLYDSVRFLVFVATAAQFFGDAMDGLAAAPRLDSV